MPSRTPRRLALALALAASLLPLAACRRAAPPAATAGGGAPAHDPARLAELLRRGAQPGELSAEDRAEVERLVAGVLPRLAGPDAGSHWRIAYDDLPVGDFVSVDLMRGDGDQAPRLLWMHVLWRGPLPAGAGADWPLRVGRWPARGVPGHHLFVRAGGVEVRAVACSPAFADDARMRALLAGIDLDGLARSDGPATAR